MLDGRAKGRQVPANVERADNSSIQPRHLDWSNNIDRRAVHGLTGASRRQLLAVVSEDNRAKTVAGRTVDHPPLDGQALEAH